MDSGVSAHMTYRRDYFDTYEVSGGQTAVNLANNCELKVAGKGIVKIKKFLNGKWYDAIITNVLHVPELRKNLFSEGAITRRGMTIVKEGDRAEIFENGRLSASAVREKNNFFRMLFCVFLIKEVRAVEKTEVSEREVPEMEEEEDLRKCTYEEEKSVEEDGKFVDVEEQETKEEEALRRFINGAEKLQENNYLKEEESKKEPEGNNYLEKETVEELKETIKSLKEIIERLVLEKEEHEVDDMKEGREEKREEHSEVNDAQNHHQPENSNRPCDKLGGSSNHDLSLVELDEPMESYKEVCLETNINEDSELDGILTEPDPDLSTQPDVLSAVGVMNGYDVKKNSKMKLRRRRRIT